MSSLNSIVRNAAIIGILFLLSGGIILIVGDVESSMIAKAIWGTIYVFTCLLVFMSSSSVLSLVQRNSGFMILALLCLASATWSSDRSTTVSHSIAFFGSTMLGYLIATKIEPIKLLRLMAIALSILLAINVVMMLPNLSGYLGPSMRYSGSFPHANMLGRISGLAVLMFLLLLSTRVISLTWGCAGAGMGGLLLIACESMTSIVALCVAFGVFLIRRVLGGPVGVGCVAVAIWFLFCSGGLIWVNWSAIIDFSLGLMGRSSNLTGRTGLWEGIWDVVLQNPILGYGYSAFWGGEKYLVRSVFVDAGWHAKSAHNGLLGIALDLGFVGVLTFVFTAGRSFLNGFKLAFMSRSRLSILLLSILSYLLILGLAESNYVVRNSIYWVLFLICSVYLLRIKDGEVSEGSATGDEEKDA